MEHGELKEMMSRDRGLNKRILIKFIKSQRLRWVAHVMRMQNTRTTRKITEWKPYKRRPVWRCRLM